MIIYKAPETMTSKKRVMKTFAFEKTDRVPIDYSANPIIHHKLCNALGIRNDSYDELFDALGVDFCPVWANYSGPLIYPQKEGMNVNPEFGYYTRWIENSSGGYEDYCYFPLKDADEEQIFAYPFPDPDNYDYGFAMERLKAIGSYAVYVGNPGLGDVMNSLGNLMGMEDALVNLMTEDKATLDLVSRRADLQLKVTERLLDKAKGQVDFMWMGEDLGTQIAPMISMKMYRKVIKPIHMKFIDLAKSYNLPVMVHTCGSSSWVYEEFIKMGVNAVDTLQPEAVNMSPHYLKEHFGGRLSFHGCISTAGALANGTVEDVRKTVRETLDIMMPGGGYFLSPTHCIQDNSPVENIIVMYQSAHDYGRYK